MKLERYDASKALVSKNEGPLTLRVGVQNSFEASQINNALILCNNPEDQNPCKRSFISDFTRSSDLITIKSQINPT